MIFQEKSKISSLSWKRTRSILSLNQSISRFTAKKIWAKNFDISGVVSKAKNLIVTSEGIDAVKFFDNKGKIIFSTVSDEKIQSGSMVNFISNDKIEARNDFFYFRDARPGFLFDQKNGYLILKKNITYENNPVGIMLFYLKDGFLTDIIRNYSYIDFKKPFYLNSNIILLYKPDEVPEDYLFNFTLDKNKLRLITFRDKSGTEIQKPYMLFTTEMKEVDLIVARFVDSRQFIIDKRNQMILFYTFFFTLYLLVLAIILFRKNEISKLKDKSILFSISIFDEIMKAKTKEELEKLHEQFETKKENFFQDIVKDLKKVKTQDKKILEDQINLIFNKIDESFNKKLENEPNKVNFDRIELIFEKFIETIAQKGININAPVNVGAKVKTETKIDKKIPIEVEAVTDVEELEEAEAVEELEEIEKAEPLEELEEIGATEPLEELEEVEELPLDNEAEKIEEVPVLEESEAEPVEELPVEEIVEEPQIKETNKRPADEIEDLITLEEKVDENPAPETGNKTKIKEEKTGTPFSEESIDEEIPRVPEEFYRIKEEKDDALAKEIKSLEGGAERKENFLENLYNKSKAVSLIYLEKSKGKFEIQ